MNTKDIVQSIGDKITAIDLKLERLLDNSDCEARAHFEQVKSFIEEMTQIMSIKLTGELPRAIESLEKKIDSFDIDLTDNLKIFGEHLLAYENMLEERIVDEFKDLNKHLLERIDSHQENHAKRLENLEQSIDNLGRTIAGLYSHQQSFDTERLAQAIDNLNSWLNKQGQEDESRTSFWGRKKK